MFPYFLEIEYDFVEHLYHDKIVIDEKLYFLLWYPLHYEMYNGNLFNLLSNALS